jgi:hypothetical protein
VTALATATGISDKSSQKKSLVSTNVDVEVDSMIGVSYLIYAYGAMRNYAKARPDVYEEEELILNDMPVTVRDVARFIKKNEKTLMEEEEFKGPGGAEYFAEFKTLQKEEATEIDEFKITRFNDKVSNQLVYGIVVNERGKCIILSFRGTSVSFNRRDVLVDLMASAREIDNPLYETKNQPRKLLIHKGFYGYLLEDKEQGKLKFDVIMEQLVVEMKKYPGYKLYVTGHSLGAALASLFTFFASLKEEMPTVRCISIASPFVGNHDWRQAFMLQEKRGRIRYLRVSSHGDIVTKGFPVFMPSWGSRFLPVPFEHVGVHLHLYDDTHRFSYPCKGESPQADIQDNFINPLKLFEGLKLAGELLELHMPPGYDARRNKSSKALKAQYLDDFYADESFVGHEEI